MDKKLLNEINTKINLQEEFAEFLGVALEDIPAELLEMGRALALEPMDNMGRASHDRAGEMDWRKGMQGGKEAPYKPKTYRDPTRGGMPTSAQRADAQQGDFVVVNGKPVKIVDKKEMFGGNQFVYLQGMQKPVIADRLNLHKRVGKVNVFSLK